MPLPEVTTALKTQPATRHAESEAAPATADALQDPLVDPMNSVASMAPPVEQPIDVMSIQEILHTIATWMSIGDPALQPLYQGAFGGIHGLVSGFVELEVMTRAGVMDPLKAAGQRVHLLTMLDTYLSTLPEQDPRIVAFKARVKRDLAQAWERRIELLQQQATAAEKGQLADDRKSVAAIKESLFSAVVE
ncbi:MAG: hypothetical protein VX899_06320 [Myxococcota bacterium]|nr:hypothetical protein [Myxococcota bacterium]